MFITCSVLGSGIVLMLVCVVGMMDVVFFLFLCMCCGFVFCVHPVAILNAVFRVVLGLWRM